MRLQNKLLAGRRLDRVGNMRPEIIHGAILRIGAQACNAIIANKKKPG